jgi:hypothetical protein
MRFGTLVWDLHDKDGNKIGEFRCGEGVGSGVRSEYDAEKDEYRITTPLTVSVELGAASEGDEEGRG